MKRLGLLVLALSVAGSGCSFLQKVQAKTGVKVSAPAPECVRMADNEIAWTEERDVGGALALALAQKGGGILVEPLGKGASRPDSSPTDQLTLAVAQVGFTVAGYSSRPEIPWVFGVLDSDTPNAFSTPGGYVLVTRGLLAQVENEAQLAGVLAHEVGHVALRHALHVYRTTKVAQCYADSARASTLGTVNVKVNTGSSQSKGLVSGDDLSKKLFTALIDPTIDLIISKGYAQSDELEADAMAADLLVMAGYDAREYQKLLAKLPAGEGIYPNHPQPAERAAKVAERLKSDWADFAVDQSPAVPCDSRITAVVRPKK